jgi:hypothetical protein
MIRGRRCVSAIATEISLFCLPIELSFFLMRSLILTSRWNLCGLLWLRKVEDFTYLNTLFRFWSWTNCKFGISWVAHSSGKNKNHFKCLFSAENILRRCKITLGIKVAVKKMIVRRHSLNIKARKMINQLLLFAETNWMTCEITMEYFRITNNNN